LEGKDVCIIALGSMVKNALCCASLLKEEGISTFLVNARFIKPLDEVLLRYIGNNFKTIITVEEGSLAGGFGSAVMEFFSKENISEKVRLISAGFPDEFITFAKREKLFEIYGLDGHSLSKRVKQVLTNEILLQK
jgi:1-deoxy-D-xylulose-5-phosphate synthase